MMNNVEKEVYSVKEISNLIKQKIESNFTSIRIRGEISGLKIASSGHAYFNLKDADAIINAICWRSTKLPVKLEDGLEILCNGTITTYPERSLYQIIVNTMEISGAGALLAILEKRKQKFIAEGIFDQDRKKKLPFLPRIIGIVTSINGAVIRDMLHRIADRFPARIIIWNVLVQGADAPEQIVTAINGFQKISIENRPDVLIVSRGGGSLEDLWAFNEENVVYAIANSNIPTISAVGHETDFTLADFASDLRAPTPTAAAELVLPVKNEINEKIQDYKKRYDVAIFNILKNNDDRINMSYQKFSKYIGTIINKIIIVDNYLMRLNCGVNFVLSNKNYKLKNVVNRGLEQKLNNIINIKIQAIDHLVIMLVKSMLNYMNNKLQNIIYAEKLLAAYSYKQTLKRGFVVIRRRGFSGASGNNSGDNSNNVVVSKASDLNKGDDIMLEFYDSTKNSIVV